MGTLVNYMTEKGVAVLTLNDPPVNAYSYEMLKELDAYILEARFDNDVHVIVLTGHGEKFFCAGANINMLREADTTFKYYFCLHANETISRLEQTPKLVHRRAQRPHRRRRPRDRARVRHAHRARAATSRSASPRSRSACSRAPAARSASRASLGKSRAIEMMVEGSKMNVEPRRRARPRQQGLVGRVERRVHPQGRRLRARVLPAERRGDGRRAASSAPCRAASR